MPYAFLFMFVGITYILKVVGELIWSHITAKRKNVGKTEMMKLIDTPMTADGLMAEALEHVTSASPTETVKLMADGAFLVDIRVPLDRHYEGVIPSAYHHELTVFAWRLDPTGSHRNKEIAHVDNHLIIMCNDGYSSTVAGLSLMRMGYKHIYNLTGGFRALRDACPNEVNVDVHSAMRCESKEHIINMNTVVDSPARSSC